MTIDGTVRNILRLSRTRKILGVFHLFHRPSGYDVGGNNGWRFADPFIRLNGEGLSFLQKEWAGKKFRKSMHDVVALQGFAP